MITEEQRKQRKNFIGASDIAALFTDDEGKSLNPFATALDVWALKVYDQEPDSQKESKAISIGHRYESALIEFAEGELGCKIGTHPESMRFVDKKHLDKNGNPVFACNLDGLTVYDGVTNEIVEAKTTGLTGEWGEPGTDDVPFRVLLQVQHQMLCTGLLKAHIAVLLGKWGLEEHMYVVERNEDIITAIVERGLQFWNEHVLTKIPPPDSEPGNIELFKRIIRVPEKFAEVDNSLIGEWETRKTERLYSEKLEKIAFAELLLELGDAEGVNMDAGRTLTYFKQERNGIDSKLLKADYPEVHKAVQKTSVFRVARIKKGK